MSDRLSDYLLGELDPAERAAFEALLRDDATLRAEVERLAPVVGRLQGLEPAAWEEPPPLAPLPALDADGHEAVTWPRAPGHEAGTRPARRWWQRTLTLRPLPAAALASVLLGLGVAAGLIAGPSGGDPEVQGRVLALAPVAPLGDGARGEAVLAETGGRATIRVSGLEPSADGEFYELWLLNDADDLVSLGSFDVPDSGEIEVTVPVPRGAEDGFAAIDVSVEPPDGDPAHSSRSVLRAPLRPS